ncbi:MAG: adenylate/guanylate cyclase domain-containing protein, partial [Rhodobacteraceae bacterium]|nr:adenylate/guanylate cyclase domain-containing protein [Paracoccaceae bacterium]
PPPMGDAPVATPAPKPAKKKPGLRADLVRRRELLKRQEAERRLPLQLFLIFLNSFMAAVVVSMCVALGLRQIDAMNTLADPELARLITFMSFLISFFVALLVLMRRLPPNWWKMAEAIVNTPAYVAPEQKWGGVLDQSQTHKYAPLFDTTRKSFTPAPATLAEKDGDTPFTDAPADSAPPAASEGETPAENDASAAEGQAGTAEAAPEPKVIALQHVTTVSSAIAGVFGENERKVDAIGRFTKQLFLAGACSSLAERFELAGKDAMSLVVESQTLSGTPRVFAESFAGNIESFSQSPHYRPPIDAGRAAMENELAGLDGIATAFGKILDQWATPENATLVPKVTTFIMTDIVDAADLKEKFGNVNAQRVVKLHNDAVEIAMKKHGGKLAKSTGDGAVVIFPDPAKAVSAARDVFKRLNKHNRARPDLSVNVRLSVHAGELTRKGGEFFGAAVKTAARICQMARAGQILASDSIRAFCKDAAAQFGPAGELEDPVFEIERPIFEVAVLDVEGVEYGDLGASPAKSQATQPRPTPNPQPQATHAP